MSEKKVLKVIEAFKYGVNFHKRVNAGKQILKTVRH